jgi:hypothetical protein
VCNEPDGREEGRRVARQLDLRPPAAERPSRQLHRSSRPSSPRQKTHASEKSGSAAERPPRQLLHASRHRGRTNRAKSCQARRSPLRMDLGVYVSKSHNKQRRSPKFHVKHRKRPQIGMKVPDSTPNQCCKTV